MKKLIATLLSVMLIAVGMVGLVACGEEDDPGANAKFRYNITVWVGEDTSELTKQLITKFNQTNGKSIWFYANVNEVSESKAHGDVMSKPGSAPELFCFVQDSLARLVNNACLSAPGGNVLNGIKAEHTEFAVNAATVGDTVYAYPLTEDNGYFLYYDTRVIKTAEQADSVEGIMAACVDAGKKFSIPLNDGQIVSAFFNATGATSKWIVDNKGRFTDYEDKFDTAEGLIAAKGIQKIYNSPCYLDNGKGNASDFTAGIPAGAVISGIWDYRAAKTALGANLGIAKLPSFEVDGVSYRLAAFRACKLLGVSPQSGADAANKAAALSLLAQFLTNNESQMARFDEFGWGPSTKAAETNTEVLNNIALKAYRDSATQIQGQFPANWWGKAETLSTRIKVATSDFALQAALDSYKSELDSLIDNFE